jgi:hypothetical protein
MCAWSSCSACTRPWSRWPGQTSPPLSTASPARLLFNAPCFLPSPGPSRLLRDDLTLGSVSPHPLHSGKTHESRAMNARPSRARAAARPSLGSLASACTLPTRSPSKAA